MVRIFPDRLTMAKAAAAEAAESLQDLLARKPQVRIVAATGASQLDFLEALVGLPGIDWNRVELFHLDEYAGLGVEHPASFARYIKRRIIDRTGISRFHLLDGTRDPLLTIEETGRLLATAPADLAFVGIGENGHLAFNDPPADFDIEDPYLLVTLDLPCRQQQVGEGWFTKLEEVPEQAISMSVRQILKTTKILCIVPDQRKANAVKSCLEGPVSPACPASILRVHPDTTIYLDAGSSSLLTHAG